MLGKNLWEELRKNVFLNSHEYRDHRMRGKKRAKQFFQKLANSASKKCLEKNCRKDVRKNVFYIHTNIGTKKCGEKTHETIFPQTHE